MQIKPFKLERYFAQYEFSTRYLLSSSDSQALKLDYVLSLADAETARLWQDLSLGYTESLGHPFLRREIAGMYGNVGADDVLVCTPEEGIFLALNAILKPGDHVICTFPGYQSLFEIARSIGCRVTFWQPEEEHAWRFNPAFLEKEISPQTRLLVFNFPHNPTGYLPDRADFTRIMDIAREHRLWVFSDEMYRMLEFDPADRLSAACEVYDRALSLNGMSKAFGLPGARIGWLVGREPALIASMAALKDYTTICSSAPSEILALITLRARERILTEQMTIIKRNWGLLGDFFSRHPDLFSWNRPKAGTICFPRLKTGGAAEFCRQIINNAGIMLLPSTVYDYGDSHFRVGFGRADFPTVLARFEESINRK